MSVQHWFDTLKSRFTRPLTRQERRAAGLRGPAARRLGLETLEDRRLLTFLLPAVNYDAGIQPQSVAVGYFNDVAGDGIRDTLDLAVVNYSDSTVSLFLGNLDGTFQPALISATGSFPLSVAVGDFNDDGILDLATANAYDVSVMLGDGLGSFGPAASIGVIGNPQSVAVGDFNDDGFLDLGVTSNDYYGYYGYANVVLGDGAGGFSAGNFTFIDYAPANTALAVDLNGDIYEDFVTFDSNGYVTVLLGDSSGYLQGPTGYFYTGDYSYAVAAGDVNGDGSIDLVTANYFGNSVGVLLGDGLGGFSGLSNYDVGSYPTSIVLGDFTGDGNLDVATTDDLQQVSVLYGTGDGTFSTPVVTSIGSNASGITAGDFDGDGWLDAATANANDNSVSVLLNDHLWPTPPPPPPPTVSINDVTISEGNVGSANATFTLSLSRLSAVDVMVHYATADITASASDYTGASADVIIPHGQLSQTFTVAVIGDRLAEVTETFAVNLSAPVNTIIVDGQGIGTILDDEPLVSINDVTVTEANTAGVNATFTVTLSALSDVDVTVHYATANGSATAGDYTGASADVTIPHGQISRTFTIAVTGDRLAESTETFVVNLTAPINAGIADDQGIGSILDNEPRLSINSVSKKEGNGATTQFIFTVTLSAAYDQPVTVNYNTANGSATAGSDYQSKSGTLTFAPGVRTMTITITVIANKTKEPDEMFFVNLSGASSNAAISVAQGIGTILNDDRR